MRCIKKISKLRGIFAFLVVLSMMLTLFPAGQGTSIISEVSAQSPDTRVSGVISSDTTWTFAGSPHTVTGNVLVMDGVTLTIEPGVVVKFDSDKALQIDGQLIARGTEGNIITFTSNLPEPAPGDWGYILFSNSSVDATYDVDENYTGGSILEYCVVEYAGGVSVENNGAVRIDNASPSINESIVRNNNSTGINIFRSTDPWNAGAIILNSTIVSNNIDYGIFTTGSITLMECTISNNHGVGVYVDSVGGGIHPYCGPMTLIDNVIANNTGTGVLAYYSAMLTNNDINGNGGGGFMGYGGEITLAGNRVENNTNSNTSPFASNGGGVTVYAHTYPINLRNNVICSNVTALSGGGVDIGGTYNGGTVTLENNLICNNMASSTGGGVDGLGSDVTISDNIIANNTASEGGGIYGGGDIYSLPGNIIGNSIIGNSAQDAAAVWWPYPNDGDFKYNTIAGNQATGPTPTYSVHIKGHPHFSYNNIINNTSTYALWNDNPQGSPNLNSENNWWGTTVDAEIQGIIYDWFDDSSLGIVDYIPYLTTPDTDATPSPPSSLTATAYVSSIDLSWNPNPEADIAGYRVYYDTDPGFPYEGISANEGSSPIDVGNVTEFTLSGLGSTYYLAITAYDGDGNDSWYSGERAATVGTTGAISGYVYEDDGSTPLEGASVSAFDSTQFPPLFWLPDGEATTDAAGQYSIEGLPEGDYLVGAVADNHERRYYNNVHNINQASVVSVAEGADTDDINFSLDAGGTISGTVTDQASGLPAADVSVVVNFQNTQGGLYITITDENGDYTLNGLPYADYQVSSPGLATLGGGDDSYIREIQNMITVADGINPTGIDFALEVGGTISGHVYLEGGSPAVRAMVIALVYGPSMSGPAPGAALVDETGYYVTTGLPAGLYAVQVQATGYINEWYDNTYNSSNSTPVEVTVPGDTGGIDFTLELAGSISGIVLDSITGEPVNDAGNGSIDLSTGWHKFVYRHEECTGGQTSRAAFKDPGDTDWRWFSTSELEIRTAPDPGADSGIQLTNKKNTWTNHPNDHAQLLACVDIDSTEEEGWYGSSIVTAVNHSENIHGNDDYFTSYYEGYFYADTAGTWQFSTDSDDASELSIDDQVVAYWYSGHGSANRWEHKMIISVERADTREYVTGTSGNADGSYTIASVPSGCYLVSAFSSGYTREWYNDIYNRNDATPVTVAAPDNTENINFGLERGGTISGHVYESNGITPIANIHVYATDFDTNQWKAGTNTTADGSYVISGVPTGSYRLRTCASCNGLTYIDEYYDDNLNYDDATFVTVNAPLDTPDIDFSLELGGTISGHVYETDGGDPIANAKISAIVYETISGKWLQLAWTETDETGYYITSGLPAGEYGVRVQADGFTNEWYNGTYQRNEAAPVTVTVPDNTPGIDLYLEPGGSISGHVYESDGVTPISNLHVNATDIATMQWMNGVNTDTDGYYVLSGLPGGSYVVRACASCSDLSYIDEWYEDAYFQSVATPVEVIVPGNTPDIDFSLELGGSISGVIRNANGSATLANISVECRRTIDGSKDWHTATADGDGNYNIRGLPYGDYVVRSPGGGRWGAGDDNYIQEYYNNRSSEGEADLVTVDNGVSPTGIDFTLEAGGSISGHVYESDGQTPIPNLHLYATDSDTNQWMSGTNTDSDGYYILSGLPEGSYLVRSCASCSSLSYIDEWYDNTYNMNEATPISVTVPDDTQDIDFLLDATVPRATIEDAIADGVAWLAGQQNPDGSWGTQYQVAKTALAVLKLETHARDIGISPFDPNYLYSDELQAGFNFIFAHAYITDVTMQPAGDPDTNGNDIGVYFRSPIFPPDKGPSDTYETGMALMAIAASDTPDTPVNVPGSPVQGWTYAAVAQDTVDFLAWGQTDFGFGRGGWNYGPMNNAGDRSDQSNSGWVTLGLAYAEDYFGSIPGFGIPGFVRTELDNYWIDYIQDDVDGDDADGGAYYTGLGDPTQNHPGTNMLRTGNLLQQMVFVGDTVATPRVQAAIDYLVRHWGEYPDPGWRGNPICYHTTYTVMKGLESLQLSTIDSINWFQDFADAIMSEQSADGWWTSSRYDDGELILSTEWALLTLQAEIPEPEQKPDLIILEKHEEWVNEQAGTYKVYFTLKNRGNVAVSALSHVGLTVNQSQVETLEITVPLEPGDTLNESFASVVALAQTHDEITVCADINQEVDELNEANNCLTNYWPEALPDLIITEKHEDWIVEGQTYMVHYTVKNAGDAPAPYGHYTGLFIDGNPQPVKQNIVPITLNPGDNYSGSFDTVVTLTDGVDEIKVCADNLDTVDELDEDNNCLTNYWPVTVEVENASVVVGGSGSVNVWVRNYPDVPNVVPYGLGSYTINVHFDPTMIQITGVSPGAPPFDAPIYHLYSDYVSITQFTAATPGSSGDIRICDLEFTCLAEGETTLYPAIVLLSNIVGDKIGANPVPGTITQTTLVAETEIGQVQHVTDGVVVIPVTIVRVKNSVTGETVTGIPIGSYTATASYDPAGIQILGVRPGDAPFTAPVFSIYPDHTEFTQSVTTSIEPPIVVARLVARLVGPATSGYDLQVTFSHIATLLGGEIPEEAPQLLSFQRGDIGAVTGVGEVNIIDAMFGAQYLVWPPEMKPQINRLNMASVKYDGTAGDKKDIVDCMFIAQYVVGIRDSYFQLTGP